MFFFSCQLCHHRYLGWRICQNRYQGRCSSIFTMLHMNRVLFVTYVIFSPFPGNSADMLFEWQQASYYVLLGPLDLCDRLPIFVAIQSHSNLAENRPTWQTSTDFNVEASKAVDGGLSGNYGHGSCTHTTSGHGHPIWAVDLGGVADIYYVEVLNRADAMVSGFFKGAKWSDRMERD